MDGIAPRDWRKVKPGTHTTEVHKETLPPEVCELIDKLVADLRDMHQRLENAEKFQAALIKEAASRLKDVA